MNRRCFAVALIVPLLTLRVHFALAAMDAYPFWDIDRFHRLTRLTPELGHPRLASIPNASSQALWEEGRMRVHQGPWDTLSGDFTGDGRDDIAVILAVGGSEKDGRGAEKYLLIATLDAQGGKRLLLQRLDALLEAAYASGAEDRSNSERKKHVTAGLLFDARRHIVGVATAETRRLTKPASISVTGPLARTPGDVGHPGYVLEKRLILPFRWIDGAFHREKACWFLDPESEDTLKANGIDPESERVLTH
jgi:hypothetical protein